MRLHRLSKNAERAGRASDHSLVAGGVHGDHGC